MTPYRFSYLLCVVRFLALAACQTPPATPLIPTATVISTTISPSPIVSPTATPLNFDKLVRRFDYDSAAPLNIQDLGKPDVSRLQITLPEGATLSEIAFDAPGGTVKGYLVEPTGNGPFAGVLWVHQYPGTNTEFLPEAVLLADKGAVSLLIEGRYPWQVQSGTFDVDRTNIINQILDLRRGLDVILTRDDIDATRLAFVGHDYGAMHGILLAGVDRRVKAYVLMTPTSSFSDWRTYFGPLKIKEMGEYIQLSPTLDPVTYMSHAAPAQLLFQFGQNDNFVSKESADALFAAASEPKQMKVYATSHALDEAARSDRASFLIDVLSLK